MFGMKRNMDNCEMCQGVFLLVSRLLLSYVLIATGFRHFSDMQTTSAALAGRLSFLPAALTTLCAWLAVVLLLVGGLMVLLGLKTRIGIMLLMLMAVPTLIFFHNYWAFPAAEQPLEAAQFSKYLALLGGLFALFVKGGGNYSIDGLLRRGQPAAPASAH